MSAGLGWDHSPDGEPGPVRVAVSVTLLTVLLAGAVVWSSCAPVVQPVVGMCP